MEYNRFTELNELTPEEKERIQEYIDEQLDNKIAASLNEIRQEISELRGIKASKSESVNVDDLLSAIRSPRYR